MNAQSEVGDPKSAIRNQPSEISNAYTDSPELHPNLILGMLQLLFWLFFHPSAWRNHVKRIDPELRPDFCLAELKREHWRNPLLWRLLVQSCIIWPLAIGGLVGLVSLVFGKPPNTVAQPFVYTVTSGLVGSVTGCVASSVVFGAAFGAAQALAGSATAIMINNSSPGAIIGASFCVAQTLVSGVVQTVISQALPYSPIRRVGGIIIGILISVVVFSVVFGVVFYVTLVATDNALLSVASGVAGGVAGGIAFGLHMRSWRRGVTFGLVSGVIMLLTGYMAFESAFVVESGITNRMVASMVNGVFMSVLLSVFFALPYALTEWIAGPTAGAVAGGLGGGGGWLTIFFVFRTATATDWPIFSIGLLGISLGLTLSWWRPVVFYPLLIVWNYVLLRMDERRLDLTPQPPSLRGKGERVAQLAGEMGGVRPSALLHLHSAFWDEHQRLPLIGLDEHLVLVMEHRPAEGQAAMEYLATSRQRWAAQAAQIELDARRLESCADVNAIGRVYTQLAAGELEGPASALLRSYSSISQDTEAALNQSSAYNQRLALKAVEDRLDGLLRELTRSSERYAVRFRPIAVQWRQTIKEHVDALAQEVEARQEIDNPYILGVPITQQQEIFVGRSDVSARIEQLLIDRRRPPLLLYGQRRMGKTSLLTNLGRLLPGAITPLFVDSQGPVSLASDPAGLLANMAEAMAKSAERQRGLTLPNVSRHELADDPFSRFSQWLDEVEQALGQGTALLLLDEFETLDDGFREGRYSEKAVLGMLRHVIQHRPRFKLLMAGSHTLEELQHWSSYLINVQVVHVSYLKEDEARQLIERPVPGFALRYEPEASRRVLTLTRGHPYLVQLLCSEIVALKNEQAAAQRRLATVADVEAAAPEALQSGGGFFPDIHNQVSETGLAVLRYLAAQGEGAAVGQTVLAQRFPDGLEGSLELLRRRELIEEAGGGWRFQVELIRRWFAR